MSSNHPGSDPVTPAICSLIDAFGVHPESLCFPGVDHESLAADAQAVREAAQLLAQREQALAEARAQLDEHRQRLQARAVRGLAYARVYAQDDEALAERLASIELSPKRSAPRRAKKAPRRPRTRRTKPAVADESVTELPFSADEAPAATPPADQAEVA